MSLFQIASILLALAALFGYVNRRVLGLPPSIGLVVVALAVALGVIGVEAVVPGHSILPPIEAFLARIDLDAALLEGALCFLLFAGALHVELDQLLEKKWVVGTLATVGVMLSTFLVGGAAYGVFRFGGVEVPFVHCLIFGALISPTDPVAVLAILKTVDVPASLKAKIAGESLFNDGVGVVVFLVLVEIAFGGDHVGVGPVVKLFALEVLGGGLLGLALGYVAYRMLATLDDYVLEVLITLALVMGTYSLALALHLSGPIAVVVEGLLLGNHGRRFAMGAATVEHVDTFWELVDEILNAVLFLIIGLEALVLRFDPTSLGLGLAMIPVAVLARLLSVGIPIQLLRFRETFTPGVVRIMTVAGLKGGISVALVLSLPSFPHKELLVTAAYAVVVFTIVGQGLSVRRVLEGALGAAAATAPDPA